MDKDKLVERLDRFRFYWFGRWIMGPISGLLWVIAAALRSHAQPK